MERFKSLTNNYHQYARDWKTRTGRKVLGYTCTYFPEELAYAAGVLPVRILSKHEPDDVTEHYMYNAYCPISRDMLAQGINGRYDYLDGIGHAACCEHLRYTFASWRLHAHTPFDYDISVPSHPEEPRAKIFLAKELGALKNALEKWTGRAITKQSLDDAIAVYNTNRKLMRQVYELRRLDNPVVSGTEVMEMVLASQTMDKEEHNRLLVSVLSRLPRRKSGANAGPRLMLLGSDMNTTELVGMIESLGGSVVIDELCTGSSYLWNNVIPQEDSLMALALRYIDRPRCPLKDIIHRRRVAHIMQLVEDYNVQGVIVSLQKFCHPYQFDNPVVMTALRDRQVPFHIIEHDNTYPAAELRMRIEAFLQIVRPQPALAQEALR